MKTSNELYLEVRDFCPDDIIAYAADKEEITVEQAKARWDEMLKFLVLCVTSDKVHAPSALVDGMWHAFVLHTERYEEFCLVRLGRFIHHRPKPEPLAEFANSIEEIFTSFPDSPVRRHLWVPGTGDPLALIGDCEDGGSQCVGNCAEVGCSKVTALRTEPHDAVVALSAA